MQNNHNDDTVGFKFGSFILAIALVLGTVIFILSRQGGAVDSFIQLFG